MGDRTALLHGFGDVAAYAVIALGKLKATAARERIRSMLDHPRALVRREAKKALAKIPDPREGTART